MTTDQSLGKLTDEEHTALRERHQLGQQLISRLGELAYHQHRTSEQLAEVRAKAQIAMAEFEATSKALETQEGRLRDETSRLCNELSASQLDAQERISQILVRLGVSASTPIMVQPDGTVVVAGEQG